MTRRTGLTVFAAAFAANSTVRGKENDTMRELLEASQKEKKGVVLYVRGQSIGGSVVTISSDAVEVRNREYTRIVVRIDAIDAAAMN
jgi:hypothetical protein